jgi:hypothetical protein
MESRIRTICAIQDLTAKLANRTETSGHWERRRVEYPVGISAKSVQHSPQGSILFRWLGQRQRRCAHFRRI